MKENPLFYFAVTFQMRDKSAPHILSHIIWYVSCSLSRGAQSPHCVGCCMESKRKRGSSRIYHQGQGRGEKFPLFSVFLLEFNSDQRGEFGDKLDEFTSCGIEMQGS